MNESASFKRWLAQALLRRARQILPDSRLEWAKAMQTELDHLENDGDALGWAIGCVVAGSKERISTMFAANLKISGWIFLPEMLLCFVPLTLDWLDVIGGSSGITRAFPTVSYETAIPFTHRERPKPDLGCAPAG